jgi:hypothetical protein
LRNTKNILKKQLVKDSFSFFSKEVLGYDDPAHIVEWQDFICEQIHIQESTNEKRKILLYAPRNHAKSTVVSYKLPCWLIGRKPDIRIVTVSNVAGQAEAFLRQVSLTIENDENYNRYFPSLFPECPEKWTNKEIIVERITKEKDPTLSTTGTGGAILSKRADLIICDDLLNKDNTRTPEQRKKVLDWFNDILMPVLDPDHGILIFIGTVFHEDDLISTLMKDPTFNVKKKYKAIIREDLDDKQIELWGIYKKFMVDGMRDKALNFFKDKEKEMTANTEVLWPERWNYRRLVDERLSSGTRSFNLMYQNEVLSEETAIVKGEWVDNCKDENRTLLDNYSPTIGLGLTLVATTGGVDLAISEKETADLNVIISLARTTEGKILLMNCIYGRWSPSTIRANIVGQFLRFKHQLILVEDNAFQASLVKDMKEISDAPIRGFTTTGEKFDEFIGINAMAVDFENNKFILPAKPDDPRTIDVFQKLKHGLVRFGPEAGHTSDFVMALWFAWTALRNITSSEIISVEANDIRSS